MTVRKYYEDELAYLREMGREFSAANPDLARYLGAPGGDPDVERFLEGVAFLTSKVRAKLDDEFPELTHGLMSMLWPHYLRPIPSLSILEFSATPGGVMERQTIPKGTEVKSATVDKTSCRFQTCYDVDLLPVSLQDVHLELSPQNEQVLRMEFSMSQGLAMEKTKAQTLRLFLFGDPAFMLYLWMQRYVRQIGTHKTTKGERVKGEDLPLESLKPVGFGRDENLWEYPTNAFMGYRLLQEYFAFPQKFLFMELTDLSSLVRLNPDDRFEITMTFEKPLPSTVRVSTEHIRLFCTPIVNVFEMESDPIRVDHQRVEYLMRPVGKPAEHFEVLSVKGMSGWQRGKGEELAFESFLDSHVDLADEQRSQPLYHVRRKQAVVGDRSELYVTFTDRGQNTVSPPTETVVAQLTCTNGELPKGIKIGDIHVPTDTSPVFAKFRNITAVTPPRRPPYDGEVYWRLLSHLSLNYVSLIKVETLQGLLALYNYSDPLVPGGDKAILRRIQGVVDVQAQPQNWLLQRVPVRGLEIFLKVRKDHFTNEGDMYLFGEVLNVFFALYASINSVTQLVMEEMLEEGRYEWPPRVGEQILV